MAIRRPPERRRRAPGRDGEAGSEDRPRERVRGRAGKDPTGVQREAQDDHEATHDARADLRPVGSHGPATTDTPCPGQSSLGTWDLLFLIPVPWTGQPMNAHSHA